MALVALRTSQLPASTIQNREARLICQPFQAVEAEASAASKAGKVQITIWAARAAMRCAREPELLA